MTLGEKLKDFFSRAGQESNNLSPNKFRALQKHGAEGGTRTPTGCPTRPSNVRVCQFRHFGPAKAEYAGPYAGCQSAAETKHASHRGLPQPRVERVANPLAEQVVGEHGDQDGEAWIEGEPPRIRDEVLAVVQDVAPGGVGRLHPEAEE